MNQQQRDYNAFRVAYDVKGIQPERARAVYCICEVVMDGLMNELKVAGLHADPCDLAHACESAIYAYIKASNPGPVADVLTMLERQGDAA